MTRLRVDSAALAELPLELKYYEATRPGTGRRFREAVDQVLERIKRAPQAGKPGMQGCRRMPVGGFPFSIVYRKQGVEIVICAVRPDARDSGNWFLRANDTFALSRLIVVDVVPR